MHIPYKVIYWECGISYNNLTWSCTAFIQLNLNQGIYTSTSFIITIPNFRPATPKQFTATQRHTFFQSWSWRWEGRITLRNALVRQRTKLHGFECGAGRQQRGLKRCGKGKRELAVTCYSPLLGHQKTIHIVNTASYARPLARTKRFQRRIMKPNHAGNRVNVLRF